MCEVAKDRRHVCLFVFYHIIYSCLVDPPPPPTHGPDDETGGYYYYLFIGWSESFLKTDLSFVGTYGTRGEGGGGTNSEK